MTEQIAAISRGGLLQDYFCLRLIQQCRASQQTVASYRDAFRLLLRFGETELRKPATQIALTDLNATMVLAFLDYLEIKRNNSIRSRNARLAAIKSFLNYAGLQEPNALSIIQKVLAIPMKRFDQPSLDFLSVKCQDIDNPSLTAKNAKTSITRRQNGVTFYMRHEQKIITCENGPIK